MGKKVPKKVTEVRLVYENKMKAVDRPIVTGSRDAYEILKANWNGQISVIEEFARPE